MKKLIFGLIGAGNSASNIATSITNMENCQLKGVTSKPLEGAKDLAKNLGLEKVYESNEELLMDPEIDAVVISVPHGLHHPLTMQALNAGKHVLCEKPLAISMEQGNEMVSTAESKGLKLGTFFQMRFNDASIKAKEIVESGQLGKILHGQVNVLWHRDKEYYTESSWRGKWATEGGGSLINQSSHSIDLMIWLIGKPKKLFGVYGAKTHEIEVDDNAAAVVIFDNEAYGTIQTSVSVKPGYTGKINVFGTKGGISLIGNTLVWTKEDGSVEELDFAVKQVGSSNDPKKFDMKSQINLISDFVDAVQNNRSPKVDGKEGLRAIQVITGIYESNGEKVVYFD